MLVLTSPIERKNLIENHLRHFAVMVKAVVDIKRQLMAIDAGLHADLEALLLEQGSQQEHLWGVNLYPHKAGKEFIQYTALINIRPWQNNSGMEVADAEIRSRIKEVVQRWVRDAA